VPEKRRKKYKAYEGYNKWFVGKRGQRNPWKKLPEPELKITPIKGCEFQDVKYLTNLNPKRITGIKS